MLVTPDQARAHLRLEPDYPIDQVQVYLDAAEEQAQEFLNRRVYVTAGDMADAVLAGEAGDDPMVVNKSIQAAILLIFGHLAANREDVTSGPAIELPMGSRTLLQPYRVGMGV